MRLVDVMRAFIPLTAALVVLAGCATPEERAAREQRIVAERAKKCRDLGAVTREQFFQCQMQLQRQEAEASRRQGEVMMAVGQALMTPPPQPQPVTCNTYRMGSMLTTNCY